jgi:hypothetical protein
LAKAVQPELNLEVRAITEGGISLGEMWHKREVQDALDKEHWDYVVLQEHSMMGWAYRDGEEVPNDPAYFWQSMNLYAPKIRRAGAVPVLYLTWARRSKPELQGELDYAYWMGAREHKARIAPVGKAWGGLRAANPEVELFANDGSHPSLAGSYLAACVFVNTLLETRVSGLPAPNGIPAEAASAIHAAADGAAEDWRKTIAAGLTPKRRISGDPPPASEVASISFQGTWRGKTWLYRQPAQVEAEVKVEGDQCSVLWTVNAEQSGARSARPSVQCKIEAGSLIFAVHDWFSSAVETHQVRLQGRELVGRVSVAFRTSARHATGTWRARQNR